MIDDLVRALDFERLWREVRGVVYTVGALIVAWRVAILLLGEHRRET